MVIQAQWQLPGPTGYAAPLQELDYFPDDCHQRMLALWQTWVLIKPEDLDEPQDSIWTRIEYATIKRQESGIFKVDRLDGKGENPRNIWKMPETGAALQAGKPQTGTASQAGKSGVLSALVEGVNGTLPLPGGATIGLPPSPMGGQPSMYQNGPPGGN